MWSSLVKDKDFTFTFSMTDFVQGITSCDLDQTRDSMEKVVEVFKKCEKGNF